MQSYMQAGDFTPMQRLKSALRANAVAYISLGVLAAALLIYIAAKNHLNA